MLADNPERGIASRYPATGNFRRERERERERRVGEEESEEEKERVRERREEERKRKSRNKRERRSRKNSSPIFSLILFLFPPLPLLMWTVTWHRISSFAIHVSVCALLAVDLDNSKGGSGFGCFSKGHDVR